MNSPVRITQRTLLPLVAAAGVLLAPATSQAQDNTAYGSGALHSSTATNVSNSAFGFNALYKSTTGSGNTAMGLSALFANVSGGGNTAIGQVALYSNINGGFNTATGFWALHLNTAGSSNTADGAEALFSCATDSDETAIGYQALYSDVIGFGGQPNQNVAAGYQALYSSTDGFENLAAGYRALYSSTHGDQNTAIGWQALLGITTGANNIAIGHSAGSLLTTGSANIDIGHPGMAGDNKIIRIGDGTTQTDTYLTGVIHGKGAGLTGVPASALTGAIAGSQLGAGSVTSAILASNLALGGTTTGIFSGTVSGNGSGLSSVPASAVTGTIPATQVSGTLPATQVGTPPPGMVLVPAGSFTMGNVVGSGSDSDISDAAPVNVTVSAFYMDANLVTLAQWQSIYYWATSNGYTFDDAGGGDGARNPVYNVNWWDCVKWCNARSQQAGLTPVYYTDAGFTTVYQTGDPGSYQTGDTGTVYMNMAAGGYRLPTEAEWEKAARGGLSGHRFPWGDTITENLANYFGNTGGLSYDLGPDGFNALDTSGTSSGSTTPIGTFPAYGYGLYDMAGNVAEWCWDLYGTPYGQPTTTNPTGPTSGYNRVARGGNWGFDAGAARCAERGGATHPQNAFSDIGFRSVLSPGQP